MAKFVLNVETKEAAGKGAARAIRNSGRVPAVVYGGKKEPIMVSLHPVELTKALDTKGFYQGDIELVEGKTTHKVSCKDVQFHVVTDFPIHVDFLRK